MPRAYFHIGTHKHLIAKGHCRDAVVQIQKKVKDQVAKTPNATPSAISLAIGKELFMQGLINEDGIGNVLSKDELILVYEKWSKLNTSSMNNMIFDVKVNLGGGGYVDNILKLKKTSRYDYIHNSCFPGHRSNLAYIFKMYIVGLGSGVNLVCWMQKRRNLQPEFIMFDHVKHASFLATLVAHVFHPIHYKVMTNCYCDMKSKMANMRGICDCL